MDAWMRAPATCSHRKARERKMTQVPGHLGHATWVAHDGGGGDGPAAVAAAAAATAGTTCAAGANTREHA